MKNHYKNDIWVYIDLRNSRLFGYSLNVLSAAREISGSFSGNAVAVLFDSPGRDKNDLLIDIPAFLNAEDVIDECILKGADYVYILEHPQFLYPRSDTYSRAFSSIINDRSPRMVLFPLTDFGREMASRCARLCKGGLMADCAEFSVDGEKIIAGCPSWGGEVLADLAFSDPKATGFGTVQPYAFQASNKKGTPGTIERIPVTGMSINEESKFLSCIIEKSDHRQLEDADIVVVGGAGVVNSEGFGMVRRLSTALGGEVGATRPPVYNGWVDEERMIGQTGKRVKPRLLISVGTSGAIQYTAGIAEANTIVAVNRDRNAPIFQIADLGVITDSKSFLPLLTEKLKQVTMRDLADVLSAEKESENGSGFGAKLIKLRKAQGWSLEDLSQKTGQPPEHIQQVENDEIVPTVSFLLRISKALGVDPGTFLRDEEKAAIQDQRAQAFIKRTKNYYYQTLTPGAENEHLRAFMITIEPNQAHKPVAYKHEGEEFIYVMEGKLQLTLDQKVSRHKPGESVHFNSETPHKLKNIGKETTKCLVVLYTP